MQLKFSMFSLRCLTVSKAFTFWLGVARIYCGCDPIETRQCGKRTSGQSTFSIIMRIKKGKKEYLFLLDCYLGTLYMY